MARRPFTLAAVVSLVMCVAVVVLWARSGQHDKFGDPFDAVHAVRGTTWVEAASADGSLFFLTVSGFEVDAGTSAPYRFWVRIDSYQQWFETASLLPRL